MNVERWQHAHSFGQEHRRAGESRTLIVIAITATMMVVEVAAGIAMDDPRVSALEHAG